MTARRTTATSPRIPRRFRALGNVDPRRLPPSTPYPCDDPHVGTRVAGDDFAGTVIGCATPPPGKRGAHFVIGSVASGSAIGRARKQRAARAEALRARYEGEDFDARGGRARRPRVAAPPPRELLALPAPEARTEAAPRARRHLPVIQPKTRRHLPVVQPERRPPAPLAASSEALRGEVGDVAGASAGRAVADQSRRFKAREVPPMSSDKFSKTVPTPQRSRHSSEFVLDYFHALKKSRTLRYAVEQMQEEFDRSDGRARFHNGAVSYPGFGYVEKWDTSGALSMEPPESFVRSRRWSHTEERQVVRKVFDALVAWGKLVDPYEHSRKGRRADVSAEFKSWEPFLDDASFVAISRELMDELKSSRRVYSWPGWRTWFGLDEAMLRRHFFRAEDTGELVFDMAGSIVDIRFPRPGMHFRARREVPRENPARRANPARTKPSRRRPAPRRSSRSR